ncbi:DUF4123 domain-containing protein [Pseudomonas sp. R5(2019)]|uniref:DUF4123 domain-containing protein n=1 Tax=Pseudomonas sp. R5(2019) TaxID=2697566 RepID=UPI0014126E69|nr:DUF4123 domain-containing protein [Pseudomonas sp. R5(2019)]NBA95900.1 DUF4123 domain-containing protein [Pseudomonas sp. R5(2019)]
MIEALEHPELPEVEDESRATWLLLESEVLEEWLCQQPDAVEKPSIASEVRKTDYACSLSWVWSETEYDGHERRGPLLVRYYPGSALAARFQHDWSETDGAVSIASQSPPEQVLAHLRAILFVFMPNGNRARFRLQDTAALASVLHALSPYRAATLLGPLEQLQWRENLGPAHQWWRYVQPHGPHPVQGEFQFTDSEMALIDAGQMDHHLRKQVALTQQAPHSFHDDARIQTKVWLRQLRQWGIQARPHLDIGLEVFRHPSFRTRAMAVIAILEAAHLSPGARVTQALNHLMTEDI